MNEIVKYKNELNIQPIKLNALEQDLFMAILSRVREHGSDPITFDFQTLRSLIQDKGNSSQRFLGVMKHAYNAIYDTKCVLETTHKYKVFHIFDTWEINKDEETITIAVDPDFVPYLNDFTSGHWTRFELQEFVKLKSKYAKTLFRLLKQWRMKGNCIIMIEDLKELLGIPKSYGISDIDRRVLNPSSAEIKDFFCNLNIDKIYEHHRRGRPSVSGYQFTWTPEKRKLQTKNIQKHNVSEMTCPKCGETSVVEMTARDGHHFWKCESCEQTFGSMAEVKGYSETPSRTLKIDDTETKSEEVYIPGVEEINQLKKSLSMKSAKTANDTTDEQKSEEHTSGKKVVNPVPVKHDITKCANPMARALDAIIWPYVERNALDYPIIPKGELRKVLGMDKSYSDEDLLTMLKEALSVLVDLGWYDDIQIQVGKYKNGHMKDVLLMPFVKTSQA